jgi:hypothetical protein
MAEDWTSIGNEVADALASVGFQVTHKRKTYAAGPNEWTNGAETSTQVSMLVVKSDYSLFEIDGINVLATDERILVPVGSVAPKVGDHFTVNSVELRVQSIKPLDPGGTAVMYEVQLRK